MQTQRDRSLERVRSCNRLFTAAGFAAHAVVLEHEPSLVQFVATDVGYQYIHTLCGWEDAYPIALRAVELHCAS